MSLTPETKLGPYEIVARLGAGAMGEVYRARDPRLGRDIAIKILPADVSKDLGRRARFEQEARAVAALNHPNIMGLYDIGEEDGVFYLVTEFVAGETLATVLERGALPIRKLLDIAVQIADGMAAAHALRITHRDLKPLNIMVGTDGRVKILDFGLAKQATVSTDPDETVAASQTQPGMILGTVNYMSPEQARGKPTDHRSDQFSFGLILYEMAAGRRAFDRSETVQTMSAIISEDAPPIDASIPAPLAWTIDRCLAKEPADRYESSRDLFQGLRSLRDHASEASVQRPAAVLESAAPAKTATRAPRRPFPWTVAGAFAVGMALMFGLHLWSLRAGMTDQSAYKFAPFSFLPGGQNSPQWSPDGKAVAYSARGEEGPYQTYIRYLDSAAPVRITKTAESNYPVGWAPDGKRVLLRIDREPHGIWSIATVGGEPEILLPTLPSTRALAISPDNQAVAFFYPGDDGQYSVWISSPPTAAPKRYSPEPYRTKDLYNQPKLKFAPNGKQLMLILNGGHRAEEAWILPFPADPATPPHRVLPELRSFGGTPVFSWMPDSRRVVLSLAPTADSSEQLWLADTESGKIHAITSGTTSRSAPSVSTDGNRVVFRESTGSYDIVSLTLDRPSIQRLIATELDELMPAWAARKPVMAFVTNRNGPQEIWLHAEDGTERPLVTARDFPAAPVQWFMGPAPSPDGDRVVYTKIEVGGDSNRLWISAVAGGAPVPLTNDRASTEYPGSWSDDGSWFTYVSIQDGKPNLRKVKTSGQATPVLLKADVDYDNQSVPVFSPDGESIVLGETLYSADGKTSRPLGDHHAWGYAFSPEGKLLYGLRPVADGVELFQVDIASGGEKVLGQVDGEFRPSSPVAPAMHFTLTPDHKSLVYSVSKFKDNLWLLEGFAPKKGWLAKFGF